MPNGRIFIGVPSASSIHRLVALRVGMLTDLRNLSEIDLAFGHKRFSLTRIGWQSSDKPVCGLKKPPGWH